VRDTPVRLLTAVLAFFLLSGCGPGAPVRQESYVFGTRVEVQVYGVEKGQARAAVAAVLREFDRLHRMLHAWQPSELTRLNEAIARDERSIPVSPELARILAHAAGIAQASDHLFDPAIGKLVRLWGFHSDTFAPRLPSQSDIEALVRARPRMSDLTIARDRVQSRNREVMIDLGGYAKGYALDRAAALLRQQGIANALINIGGNVMALGTKGGWASSSRAAPAPSPRSISSTARPSAPRGTTSVFSNSVGGATAISSIPAAARPCRGFGR